MNINKIIEDSIKVKIIQSEINKIAKQAELDLNLKEAKDISYENISKFKKLFEDEVFTEYVVIAEWEYEIDDYINELNNPKWDIEFNIEYSNDDYYILLFSNYIQVYQDVYDRDCNYIQTRLYTINKSEFDALNLI